MERLNKKKGWVVLGGASGRRKSRRRSGRSAGLRVSRSLAQPRPHLHGGSPGPGGGRQCGPVGPSKTKGSAGGGSFGLPPPRPAPPRSPPAPLVPLASPVPLAPSLVALQHCAGPRDELLEPQRAVVQPLLGEPKEPLRERRTSTASREPRRA